jgi:hypothetical protein
MHLGLQVCYTNIVEKISNCGFRALLMHPGFTDWLNPLVIFNSAEANIKIDVGQGFILMRGEE